MSDQNLEHVSSNDSDARYFPRWEANNRVVYHLDGEKETFEGKARDINCAGACICGDCHVVPHQKIQLTVQLSDKVEIKLNGHVLWTKIENGQPQMGVTFYDTPDEIQSLILQYAFELDKDKVISQWYKGWEES